jgi:hypothetical protein
MPTHTHHQATCQKLTPPNLLQTVPQAAHIIRRHLKLYSVMSIKFKSEKFLKTQRQ